MVAVALSILLAVDSKAEILAYGSAPEQTLEFSTTRGQGPRPLVVFVHGGAWSRGSKEEATGRQMGPHFVQRGYAFASVDYRLVPAVGVEEQASDVALAIHRLLMDAPRLGIDPSRVVLMGHSAGAHLCALVGTDPSYLERLGRKLTSIRGVVLLDGAAYDVPSQLRQAGRFMEKRYLQAFGDDSVRQLRLSPVHHAAAPNVRRFLILHIDREDGAAQSRALAQGLLQGGTEVALQAVEGRGLLGHMRINRGFGEPDHPATAAVDAWLDSLDGRASDGMTESDVKPVGETGRRSAGR